MRNTGEFGSKGSWRLRILGLIVIALVVGLGVRGVLEREHNESELIRKADETAIPSVAVIKVKPNTKANELTLPGDIEAWYSAPIYARVNGYLKMWYTDIGARVKAGDLLGEIDAPDLDQQYAEGKADLVRARADVKLAIVTADRWQKLLKYNSVSQEDTDVKTTDQAAKSAAVQAAQANVDRLAALESFKRLVAPFDGVVTARRTDIGALINAGGGGGPEMFTVADIHEMRVYVRIPQMYVALIKEGMQAELVLPQYPGRRFMATLATTANAISPSSRTLLVELHADNPDGILQPGTYAEAHFQLPARGEDFTIPVSALIFQENGLQVAVVGANDKVSLHNVKVGLDMGAAVVIEAGLSANERVVDSPPDAISEGDQVRIVGEEGAPPDSQGKPQQVSEASGK